MAGHDHHQHATGDSRRLALAAGLTGGFMLVEAGAGWYAGSLALIADAGHMLTDFASLTLAWAAVRVSTRPADWKRTYGFGRFSVLAAFLNGVALFVIAGFIVVEAIARLVDPGPVLGLPMLIVAAIGLAVNVAAFLLLHGGSGGLNIRGAALHVLGDILGSVGAIAAAGIILATGWVAADPILSVIVCVLILGAAWRVVRDSGRILLEAAPPGVNIDEIAADLATLPGVRRVYHLHAWSISDERPVITLHADIEPGAVEPRVRAALRERLETVHGFGHATIETDPCPCEPAGHGASEGTVFP